MKNIKFNVLLLLGGCLIIVIQILAATKVGNFVGTDDQSVDVISQISPNYKPWASNVWELPNDSTEVALFAFQAAIGLGVIAYYIINQRKKAA